MSTLKEVLKYILYFSTIRKLRNKYTGGGEVFKSTQITFSGTANSSNIFLSDTSRVYGSISVCDSGKVFLGEYSQIGPNSIIRSVESIVIGDYTMISANVVIADNNSHSINPIDREIVQKTPSGSLFRSMRYSEHAAIRIGNKCWIGENSRICKGVTIGDGSIVAANAVVTKDVPEFTIVAGNPARIVKTGIDSSPRLIPD